MISVESVSKELAEYRDLLTFEENPEYIIIRLKEFVPKPKWDEIHQAILKLNGEYVGGIKKAVHWRVKREEKVPEMRAVDRINIIQGHLQALKEELLKQ